MFKIMVFVATSFLSFAACTDKDDNNIVSPTSSNNFTIPDSNGRIIAKVGDTIQVKILNTSSDGGYWWNITTEFDSTIAKLISFKSEYTGSAGITGAPTNQIWLFQAMRNSVDTLELKLYQSWEPENIIDSLSYILTIQ